MIPSSQTRPPQRVLLAQLTVPLRSFLDTESGSAGLLLAATVLALLWANSPWADVYEAVLNTEVAVRVGNQQLSLDLGHWISDGLMALFFFVVGLELRRELSVGELTNRRSLIVPAIAAVGGLLVPALFYLVLNPSGDAARGWGIVVGTDTAFLLGALALVGPTPSTQLRVFLLTVTIIDDVLAVSVIGVFYSSSISLGPLVVAAASLGVFLLLDRLRVGHKFPYAVAGLVLWLATVYSGLHPSIAGVAAGLLIGAYPPRREQVEHAARLFRAFRQSPLPQVGYSAKIGIERAVSINERFQVSLHPLSSFVIVPLFALANAGVDLRGGLLNEALGSSVTWGVVLGLVGGKLVGIGIASFTAIRLGLGEMPRGVGPGQVLGGAALSGIGFTVSLLIASLAFDTAEARDQATVGVLIAAVLSFAVGWLIFRLAAVLWGEQGATLPMALDRPVEPGRDHVRGPADAPMTLVEYGDFGCYFCGAATGVVHELRERFCDDLRYVFRHLPLPDVHPNAELAAQAAEAAGAQGHFWEMYDLLFKHQTQLEFEDLVGYAGSLNLDVEQFVRDLADEQYANRVREDVASAEASGVRGTPTFFIGNRRHIGPFDTETLSRALHPSI
jgi:Na+/H+ antiporter NhaA